MNRDLTGVVLAGGRGRRMGAKDKGLLPLAGRPLVQHVIDALAPQVGEVLVNANRNLGAYRRFGREVIPDADDEYRGPLAGILSGMRYARADQILVVPCDVPFLPPGLVARFWRARARQASPACVAHDGQRTQPMFCLLHRELAPDVEQFLEAGERKAGAWLERHHPVTVDFSDFPNMFLNINRPEDLAAAEQRFRERA
ncbi:MAG: molybdenum cofactor guanylyltransferase [Gammaproteobacteria bacterium]|nr:molybdenum cofactor guanylyltransferase [Gammaproteobacteria bacterium]NIR96755.1 molybdenum cofactor guanylyltransferase [Gammaproteobacteria bacterium]NIT62457.1 molybdenum cofactor guanylyltransferase [Gammaproteobacteria bacterium]NIV19390.1 molybdenum cofactor guanylyltransferase [Gammaproteobacteria bacterium]NIX10461.1 molybdenum cofactor guanylyltransferase [Gammaproteobacteria bacterium]